MATEKDEFKHLEVSSDQAADGGTIETDTEVNSHTAEDESSLSNPKRKGFMYFLTVAERAALLVAALASLLPLYQFYSERLDRKIDRASNFILAYKTCLDTREATSDLMGFDRQIVRSQGYHAVETENGLELVPFTEDEQGAAHAEEDADRRTIEVECEYIESVNSPISDVVNYD